jgi:hypothetical protein
VRTLELLVAKKIPVVKQKLAPELLVPPKLYPIFLFEFFTFILEKFILLCKGIQLLVVLESLASENRLPISAFVRRVSLT